MSEVVDLAIYIAAVALCVRAAYSLIKRWVDEYL